MSIKTMMTQFADAARHYLGSNRKLNTSDITNCLVGNNLKGVFYITASIIEGTETEIYIPYDVRKIRSRCFWGFGVLNVYIPGRVQAIAADAFTSTATLYCAFSEGDVSGAPWGAGKVIYNYEGI